MNTQDVTYGSGLTDRQYNAIRETVLLLNRVNGIVEYTAAKTIAYTLLRDYTPSIDDIDFVITTIMQERIQ